MLDETTQSIDERGFDLSRLTPGARLHYKLALRVEGVSERKIILSGFAIVVMTIIALSALFLLFRAL